ncbi:MAG: UDP-N-acetylmuramoyl-tripeptide--D-alanyl-D-alanine ligase [Patescibacteria group bacterium]
MMPLINLIYLLQLEEYDLKRFSDWLKNNPDRIVLEKKKQIDWTVKAKLIFVLANIFNIFINCKLAIKTSVKILSPIDKILKKILIFSASRKINKMPNLTVIGITGSYGKTTTKDALTHILNPKYKTLKTEGNYNTLLGVAKTILKNLKPKHEIFIVEMAAYKPEDVKSIAKITKPQIGIITAIGPMHLERFGNMETILKTKLELIESLPSNGIGFLPKELEQKIKNFNIKSKIEFFSSKEELLVKIGKIFEMTENEVLGYLKNAPPTPHRQEIIKTSANITIIDDTYNSNPIGFLSALELLKNIPAQRKILVTPGMIELGERQFELNKEEARNAAKIADYIIIVGETNKYALLEGLRKKPGFDFENKVFWVKDLDTAKSKISELAVANSIVLLENDLPDHYF